MICSAGEVDMCLQDRQRRKYLYVNRPFSDKWECASFFYGDERTSFPFWEYPEQWHSMPHFHSLGVYILKLCDYILECTISFPCISFTRGLKRKVSVNDGIWAIPKIETTYVRRFKKIRTFPLHCESAVMPRKTSRKSPIHYLS